MGWQEKVFYSLCVVLCVCGRWRRRFSSGESKRGIKEIQKGTNSTFGLISSFVNNGVIIMQKHRVGHVKLIKASNISASKLAS